MITGSLVYILEIYFEMGYLSPLQRQRQEKVGEETGGVGGLRCRVRADSWLLVLAGWLALPWPILYDSWFPCRAPILHHGLT